MDNGKISLLAQYELSFDIECKSGLHIGGTDIGGGIGEIENTILKDPMTGYPYICGSSLKGRMRERLEWIHERIDEQVKVIKNNRKEIESEIAKDLGQNYNPEEFVKKVEKLIHDKILNIGACNCGTCQICHYFGHTNQKLEDQEVVLGPTRFIFRDAMPKQIKGGYNQIKIWEEKLGRGVYTELKTENSISRLTATAVPRTMERVPVGSKFQGEIIIDLYNTPEGAKLDNPKDAFTLLFQGMIAIEKSFLGGLGSRGSGAVEFNNIQITKIPASFYTDLTGKIKLVSPEDKVNATKLWLDNVIDKIN